MGNWDNNQGFDNNAQPVGGNNGWENQNSGAWNNQSSQNTNAWNGQSNQQVDSMGSVSGIGIDASKKSVLGFSLMLYGVVACLLFSAGYATIFITFLMVITLIEPEKDANLYKVLFSFLVVGVLLEVLILGISFVREPIDGVLSTLFKDAEYDSMFYNLGRALKSGVSMIVSIVYWLKKGFILYYGLSSIKKIKNGTFKPLKFINKYF